MHARRTALGVLILAALGVLAWVALRRTDSSPRVPSGLARTVTEPRFELPEPSGPDSVGTFVLTLRDSTRGDHGVPGGTSVRELSVQFWFPTAAGDRGARTPYIPDKRLVAAMIDANYFDQPEETIRRWLETETHARLGAPVLSTGAAIPLILFSPGAGLSRASYTALCTELASRRFVIAAIDHPCSGLTVLPDGRVLSLRTEASSTEAVTARVEEMARDHAFVLATLHDPEGPAAELAARLDLGRVAVMGHSLGGAAALESCRGKESKFAACIDLDGNYWGRVEAEGVRRPCLLVLEEPSAEHRPSQAMREGREREWQTLFAITRTPAIVAILENTNHFSFCDLPFFMPAAQIAQDGATISPRRAHLVVAQLVQTFLDRTFDADPRPLEQVAEGLPEVHLMRLKN